jgi:hypothetical protein
MGPPGSVPASAARFATSRTRAASVDRFSPPTAVTRCRRCPSAPRRESQPLHKYGIVLDAFHERAVEPYRNAETGRFLPYTDAIVYKTPFTKYKVVACRFPLSGNIERERCARQADRIPLSGNVER